MHVNYMTSHISYVDNLFMYIIYHMQHLICTSPATVRCQFCAFHPSPFCRTVPRCELPMKPKTWLVYPSSKWIKPTYLTSISREKTY